MVIQIRNLFSFLFGLAWRSVSDTNVYLRAPLLPGRILVFYTFLCALLIAGGHSLVFWFTDARQIETQALQIWNELETTWPADLEFSYRQGVWDSTLTEPFVVSYPGEFPQQSGWPSEFITIIPEESNEIQTKSLFTLRTETLTVQSAGENQQTFLWSDLLQNEEILLNQSIVHNATPQVEILTRFGLQQMALFVFLWRAFGVWFLRLLGLFLYSWLAQVLWTFRGRNLNFGSVYKMGLILLPVTELLTLLWKVLLPANEPFFSFWWVWLLLMGTVIITAPRKSA